jgi:3'-phosphoadenosine 5'-phosphosulfate sulfotransferase (PAPS reductase)/FAD synthetase
MKKQTYKLTDMQTLLLEKGIVMTGDITGPVSVVVPLSGGKDSQACLMLALKEHEPENVLALFCDTGFEHPITYAHVERITEKYGVNLVMLQAGTVLEKCLKYKRFPGGGARHCTDELKLRPANFFYQELAKARGGFEVWCGMRSDESKEREARYRGTLSTDLYAPHEVLDKFPKMLGKAGVSFRLPVIDWSKSEIFELLAGNENPLYAAGFDRVGCFPCLAGGEGWQMKAFHFDEVGRKHYRIAERISAVAGRPVLVTKKYMGQGPGGDLFEDSFSGCAICAI